MLREEPIQRESHVVACMLTGVPYALSLKNARWQRPQQKDDGQDVKQKRTEIA